MTARTQCRLEKETFAVFVETIEATANFLNEREGNVIEPPFGKYWFTTLEPTDIESMNDLDLVKPYDLFVLVTEIIVLCCGFWGVFITPMCPAESTLDDDLAIVAKLVPNNERVDLGLPTQTAMFDVAPTIIFSHHRTTLPLKVVHPPALIPDLKKFGTVAYLLQLPTPTPEDLKEQPKPVWPFSLVFDNRVFFETTSGYDHKIAPHRDPLERKPRADIATATTDPFHANFG